MATESSRDQPCPLDSALEFLTRKWMLATIRALLDGPLRFVELRNASGCPSPSTFTRRLRVLEAEGMVIREILPETPVGIRYELTPKGYGLGRVLAELASWAEVWLDVDLSSGQRPEPVSSGVGGR